MSKKTGTGDQTKSANAKGYTNHRQTNKQTNKQQIVNVWTMDTVNSLGSNSDNVTQMTQRERICDCLESGDEDVEGAEDWGGGARKN